jgi:hypothetical protein
VELLAITVSTFHNFKKSKLLNYLKHGKIRNALLEMPVPSQGHYGFHSFPVVD